MVRSLEMLYDRRVADVALAQPHHIRHERSTQIADDLYRLTNCDFLKISDLPSDVVIPENVSVVFILQPVLD